MSESEGAKLNTDRNCVDSIQSNEQVKENRKWRKNKVKKEGASCEEVNNVVNHLAIKIELKKEGGNYDSKKSDNLAGIQNGSDELGLIEGYPCHVCGIKFPTGAELNFHLKSNHTTAGKQLNKLGKTVKGVRQRMQHCCLTCNGKTFGSRLSLFRHITQHVSLPEIRLTRLKEIAEERPDSPSEIPSGRPQVALKRVTASCHARSPLRFRLKLTGDSSGKDSFKLVKATSEKADEPERNSSSPKDEKLSISQTKESGDCEQVSEVEALCETEETKIKIGEVENKKEEGSLELNLVEHTEDTHGVNDAEGSSTMVEASQEQCTVPFEEESAGDSVKDKVSCSSSPCKEIVSEDIEEGIMRQMKNGEGEIEKIQGNSPSVIQGPQDSGQTAVEKNGFECTNENQCEPIETEFISIERLGTDTTTQLIDNTSEGNLLGDTVALTSHREGSEALSETHILCEACGDSVLGDQTALEDHCLCRGHYKCPVCSVACASTDALAVHTKETHQTQDMSTQPVERKKKANNLRSIRRKHQEQVEKDKSRDSVSDSSNTISPNAEGSLPVQTPQTSPSSTKTSESSLNLRISGVVQLPSRVTDRRQSPSSQNSNTSPPMLPQNLADFSQNPRTQHPNAHARPSRVSESMPPPLTRPPNARNAELQPARGNVANVRMPEPLQPPPALYKMPTTSHGVNNSHIGSSVAALSSYARGVPASGYQSDPQASTAPNLSAAMNARYQSMHHGYPAVSQPPPSYAYPQSVQMQQAQMMQQQRFPPPPYPGQMHHLQQGARVAGIPPDAYGLANSQAYNQSLLKAHLEQARMQLPQPSTMLQSMQNLQQEHYQQQQLQQQLFQQPSHHQLLQSQQHDQNQSSVQTPQVAQKRKAHIGAAAGLRYHQQNAISNQQSMQNQIQQGAPTPAKQRRVRENIGIPSKQTDSDCEIIAVQQRGEGVPVIQSIQGSNPSTSSAVGSPANDANSPSASGNGSSQPSPESTIHLTDSITLSVRQPPGSASTAGHRGHNASAVASILATRGITVTPASGSSQNSRSSSGQTRARPSPPLNRGPTTSPPQQASVLNTAISISHSARQSASQAQHSNDGFAMPAPVGPGQRAAQRQPSPGDRPPRPPTVDLTDETAAQAHAAATISQCRLCDKQFPTMEALQNHMQLVHQTRNYFRCTICNTKHPSQQALSNHVKRVHKFSGSSAPSELVIPLLDLRNAASMNKLTSLGVRHVIPLSQLGMNADNGSFSIPIMSLDLSGQQRSNTISGLMSMGTTAVLPIGPVKSLPNVQQPSQPPPQTVPSSHPSLPPPLAPIRPAHLPNQFVQPPHPLPPR